ATAASSGSDLNGMAAQNACDTIRERMAEHLAERYQTTPDQVQFADGMVRIGGERIALADRYGQPILGFTYNDANDWTDLADGRGPSLVMIDPTAVPQSDPERTDYLEDGTNWRPSSPIGGSPGREAQPVGIVVNEVLTHTDLLQDQIDAIELHNTTDTEINIGGWYLSDSNDNYRKFRIPDDTVLLPGTYRVFDESHFNPTPETPGVGDFALNGAHGDDVYLMATDASGNLIRFADHVEFPATANGETLGRWPNGLGELYPMAENTLGSANSGPRVGPVIISEVHYNPGDVLGDLDPGGEENLEFVEIFNEWTRFGPGDFSIV
ncbi:hypothetical protein LCGC14_3034300, partial [marine sediment metagenome]